GGGPRDNIASGWDGESRSIEPPAIVHEPADRRSRRGSPSSGAASLHRKAAGAGPPYTCASRISSVTTSRPTSKPYARSRSARKPAALVDRMSVSESARGDQIAHLIRQPGLAPRRLGSACQQRAKPLQVQRAKLVDQKRGRQGENSIRLSS